MDKKLQVKVNGKQFDVEIDDISGDIVNLSVNGHCYQVEFEESGSPVVHPAQKPAPTVIPAAAPARASSPASLPAASANATDAITAPMPGVIMDISVSPGDKVIPGQPVCALEAMKMKNILRSTREGIVACVEVSEGQRVPYGAVLIRFA
jgi:glutaconyl-CoA/methylmalonyl-CoA decarboxylase subunit gamma